MNVTTLPHEHATARVQIIQVESSCAPYAEADDLLELAPGDEFAGDGVYALQYVRPAGTWSGLREVRRGRHGLELKEINHSWICLDEASRAVLRFVGRVRKVHHSNHASPSLLS